MASINTGLCDDQFLPFSLSCSSLGVTDLATPIKRHNAINVFCESDPAE